MAVKTPAALLAVRDRLPDQDSFSSPLHSERTAAILGLALGVCFTITFLTGLISHFSQHPPGWLTFPPRPAGFYRVTQGLHIVTGVASIPLLFGKLWVVNPYFWGRPAVRNAAHAVERISLLPLVGGSVFMVFTGTINVARWYSPMPFFFTVAHYWVAYILIGSMIIHVGAKLAVTRSALSSHSPDLAVPRDPSHLGRRGFLGALAATSLALVVTTAGETFRPLRRLGVLAPRDPDYGSQGIPVNKSAIDAGVIQLARDPAFRLTVDGRVGRPLSLSVDELRAMPQHQATLPIACVEGWSASATWRGVRVRDLLAAAGAPHGSSVVVESLEPTGIYRTSNLNHLQAADVDSLLAMELDGQVLNVDHGYPVRLISPNRPGVLQTKWVAHLRVT